MEIPTTEHGHWAKPYFDDVGDRCKEAERRMLKVASISNEDSFIIRVDGRAFHTFTRGLHKPYDEDFHKCMKQAASTVLTQLKAQFAYVQSDEISYVFTAKGTDGFTHPFNGRKDKLLTVVASLTSVAFMKALDANVFLAGTSDRLPHFDARLVDVFGDEATIEDILHSVMWRENDAMRNSVAMLAQSVFSQKELQGKNIAMQIEMLNQKMVPWMGQHEWARRGTYLRSVTETRPLTESERMRIPEAVRPDPDTTFTRSSVKPFFFDSWDFTERARALFG